MKAIINPTAADVYKFRCVNCQQPVFSEAWRDGIGARVWDAAPDGSPNFDQQHDCVPVE